MKNNFINKVENILEKFLANKNINDKNFPCLWNMDTDIFNSWSRFSENIKKQMSLGLIDKKNLNKIKVIKIKEKNKNGNNQFIITINGVDVTPTTNKKPWSKSGLRQFLQIGSGLSFLFFSPLSKANISGEYNLTKKISLLIDENVKWKELFLSSIILSLQTDVQYIIDFGFSFFISLIYKIDKTFLKNVKPYIFKKKRAKNGLKFINNTSQINDLEYYIKDKIIKETYKGILTQFNNSDIINTINAILLTLDDRNVIIDQNDIYENHKKYTDILNYMQKLKTERCKLRENIIIERVDDLNSNYSELENQNNQDVSPSNIQCLEACHIYNIFQIKEKIINNIQQNKNSNIDSIIKQASDPNNGILLSSSLHGAFDKNHIDFNVDGELIIREEFASELPDIKNQEKVKIKSSIFTNSMKQYFDKRN